MANRSCIFLISILFLLVAACSSDEVEDKAALYWSQTKCSDPWDTKENDSQSKTKNAIISYLDEQGIGNVKIVSFENTLSDGGVTCDACICPTGVIITVEVNPESVEKMEDLGFIKK
jgi:hypothetical protein